MATAAIIAILVILYILEYSLPRYGPSYLGVIVPLLFLVVVALLMVKNGVSQFRDILLPCVGFIALLSVWGRAIEVKKRKAAEGLEVIDR